MYQIQLTMIRLLQIKKKNKSGMIGLRQKRWKDCKNNTIDIKKNGGVDVNFVGLKKEKYQ